MNQEALAAASNAELLGILVGRDLAAALSKQPLTQVMGMERPRQYTLGEQLVPYVIHPALAACKELMSRCFLSHMQDAPEMLGSPTAMRSYLCTKIGHLEYEAFWCIWLDCQNRPIATEQMFTGTISSTSVYPREVVRRSLTVNAAAVCFAHCHPSGVATPSAADEMLTRALKNALAMVDVRVIDHFIIAGAQSTSMAELGMV
jgi:DNA repair protein RadC